MSIIKEKYKNIKPELKYLSDEVILAQAWKKSHSYIRRHNWFADVLELDCSTIDLEHRLREWADQLKNHSYKVDDMRLVLAPKNKQWYFAESKDKQDFNSWSPRKDKNSVQKLRPLAHLTIRDQTVSTAVMLCLADAIETAQGPTDETDYLNAQRQGVYSYGNRLHCNWEDIGTRKRARFGWGNSRCYRQYYDDYKNFLERPRYICQYYTSAMSPNSNLYVVSLDLKEFFDHIDPNALLHELKKVYKKFNKEYNFNESLDQDDFWSITSDVFSWQWAEVDSLNNEELFGGKLPKGIPQGLVASGFFSNAYLVNFDQMVGKYINVTNDSSLLIRDYCRYVDDIRIVVEVNNNISSDQVKQFSENMIENLLNTHQSNINSELRVCLNKEKTKVMPFQQLLTQSNVSSLMNMFQNVLSGTPDVESLRQVAGGLDGLLQISEQLEGDEHKAINPLELSEISTPHIDVRDDTLKRFVATRMVKSLRLRRGMTDLSETIGRVDRILDNLTAGKMLDHEFETAARKLISSWSNNPSLTLLLRCGLDLFPDSKLLFPVIEALRSKLYKIPHGNPILLREMKVAEYISADLLKAASTDIGYRSETVYPDSANIKGFREKLATFAKEILTRRNESPWYLEQQAALYLVSIGECNFSLKEDEPELRHYILLREASLYKSTIKAKIRDRLAVSLIAQQLNPNPNKFSSWFITWMNKKKLSNASRKKAVEIVFMNRPDLMNKIIRSKRIDSVSWKGIIPVDILNLLKCDKKVVNLQDNREISLLKIIQSDSNPFKQENALLQLARSILRSHESTRILSSLSQVNDLKVCCTDWKNIQQPSKNESFLSVTVEEKNNVSLEQTPSWISAKLTWMYTLGRILRSCITGEYDFTYHTFLVREDPGFYKGIKSTWFTRRFGINNNPRGLLTEPSPISPWLSELLIRLLQWPGINQLEGVIQEFEQVKNEEGLLKLIEDRLNLQSEIFGRLSGTPFYILPSPSQRVSEDSKLQVAIVQPLLPKMDDFNEKDPMNWTPSYRSKHRNHIASICNLVNSHLKSTRSAQSTVNKESKTVKDLDLIVFPELTVHPNDIDLLRGLSDATKANIFTGLTFIQPDLSKQPINQAMWLLRNERHTGREFISIYQGKEHMTKYEKDMGIQSYRPYQVIIELQNSRKKITRLAGAICYDATDLSLVADLREVSDIFIIAAMNKDVQTFDNMVSALHYHMYQPVILANTGEFGGSTAQAPYSKHARHIAHIHGNDQVAVSIFEVDASLFKGDSNKLPGLKTIPAGFKGRV